MIPAGLVWAGIRVNELERIGYTIGEDPTLQPGEIRGEPWAATIYVWSRADFDALARLSKLLHDLRTRGPRRPPRRLSGPLAVGWWWSAWLADAAALAAAVDEGRRPLALMAAGPT